MFWAAMVNKRLLHWLCFGRETFSIASVYALQMLDFILLVIFFFPPHLFYRYIQGNSCYYSTKLLRNTILNVFLLNLCARKSNLLTWYLCWKLVRTFTDVLFIYVLYSFLLCSGNQVSGVVLPQVSPWIRDPDPLAWPQLRP